MTVTRSCNKARALQCDQGSDVITPLCDRHKGILVWAEMESGATGGALARLVGKGARALNGER